MTIPQSLSIPSDKIIYQVGLNMLKYQQIEKVAKNLVIFSDYTFGSSSTSEDEPISWFPLTPTINTTNTTMGGLIRLLCDIQSMDKDKEIEDSNEIKISIKMSHRVINRYEIETLFKKIVTDRNKLTHHFNYFFSPNSRNMRADDEVLERLKNEYENAEYLLKKLQQELSTKIDFIIEYLKISSEAITINQVADVFDKAYQECRRNDGWAVWQQVISLVYKTPNSKTSIEDLKKKINRKQTKSALQFIFPNWQFSVEPTQNGSRVLVKVDNTIININSDIPRIIAPN